MICLITGQECLREKCKQYLPKAKSTVPCKFIKTRVKLMKFYELAEGIKEIIDINAPDFRV